MRPYEGKRTGDRPGICPTRNGERREGGREGWVTKGARWCGPTKGNGRVTDRVSVLRETANGRRGRVGRGGGREGRVTKGARRYAPTNGNGRVIGWGPGDCREGRVVPALKEPPTAAGLAWVREPYLRSALRQGECPSRGEGSVRLRLRTSSSPERLGFRNPSPGTPILDSSPSPTAKTSWERSRWG